VHAITVVALGLARPIADGGGPADVDTTRTDVAKQEAAAFQWIGNLQVFGDGRAGLVFQCEPQNRSPSLCAVQA
jgi:hypothetical protein